MSGWTALLLAGERPGGDPFARRQGAAAKALIPLAGVPMVARVAETLLASPAIDRLVVLAGRYLLLVAGAAFAAALFLGGGNGPLLPAWLWLLVKTVGLLVVLVVLRRRVPVLRPELLAAPAWLVALPLALLQLLLVSVVVVVRG